MNRPKTAIDNKLESIRDFRKRETLREIRQRSIELIMSADDDDNEFWGQADAIERAIQFMRDEGL